MLTGAWVVVDDEAEEGTDDGVDACLGMALKAYISSFSACLQSSLWVVCLGMALKAPPPEECLAGTLVALGSRFTPDLQAEI